MMPQMRKDGRGRRVWRRRKLVFCFSFNLGFWAFFFLIVFLAILAYGLFFFFKKKNCFSCNLGLWGFTFIYFFLQSWLVGFFFYLFFLAILAYGGFTFYASILTVRLNSQITKKKMVLPLWCVYVGWVTIEQMTQHQKQKCCFCCACCPV